MDMPDKIRVDTKIWRATEPQSRLSDGQQNLVILLSGGKSTCPGLTDKWNFEPCCAIIQWPIPQFTEHTILWNDTGHGISLYCPSCCGILPVCIAFGDKRLHRALTWPAGVFCAVIYRCDRSHCLRLQRNAATASYQTMQPGSFWSQASTFQTVSWGSEITSPGVRKPMPKICQSWLGVWFFLLRRWYVVSLEFNICFSCCLVVGVYSVVAVSPSLVSSFTVIGGGSVNLKESIRRWVFFSDFPPTADLPANDIFLLVDGLLTGLHCFIATTWLDTNEAPGLLSKFPHLNHMRDTFLPKTKCACDVAQWRHGQ